MNAGNNPGKPGNEGACVLINPTEGAECLGKKTPGNFGRTPLGFKSVWRDTITRQHSIISTHQLGILKG